MGVYCSIQVSLINKYPSTSHAFPKQAWSRTIQPSHDFIEKIKNHLSWIVAARYPELVKKLILVSSAPFEDQYTTTITKTRLGRLSPAEQSETKALLEQVEKDQGSDKNLLLTRLGNLLAHADAFDPLPLEEE